MSDGTREVLPDSSASVLNVCCGFVGNILFHKEGCYTERRSRREFAEQELENPFLPKTFDSDGQMWNNLWTETTSDDE
jgi:hypothetical protein